MVAGPQGGPPSEWALLQQSRTTTSADAPAPPAAKNVPEHMRQLVTPIPSSALHDLREPRSSLGQARIWMQNLNYLDLQLGWTLDGKRKVFGSKFGPNLA